MPSGLKRLHCKQSNLTADAIPEFNIFGLQRLFNDLGGIRCTLFLECHACALPRTRALAASQPLQGATTLGTPLHPPSGRPLPRVPPLRSRAAGSMGVPGLAGELEEPLLFCEMMVFGRCALCGQLLTLAAAVPLWSCAVLHCNPHRRSPGTAPLARMPAQRPALVPAPLPNQPCSLEDLLKPELRAGPKYAALDLRRAARILDK